MTYTARRAAFTLLFLYCFLISPVFAVAQEYNYIHYNTKEGLAGSTVYDMVQDNEGFMWFATEAGLSRFDGTSFKNFTTADGLPDAEIFRLYVDHKGRLWIVPFKNTLCYYYKGSIHTAANDSLLKLVKLDNVPLFISGDIEDDILLLTGTTSHILRTRPGEEQQINLVHTNKPYQSAFANFDGERGFMLHSQDTSYLWKDGKLSIWKASRIYSNNKYVQALVTRDKVAKVAYYNAGMATNGYYKWDTKRSKISTHLIGTTNGGMLIDTVSFDRVEEIFLPDKMVNSVWIDFENNMWFGTTGEGLYKLMSRNFKTLTFPDNRSPEVFSLEKRNNIVLAGGGFNKLYEVQGEHAIPVPFWKELEKASQTSYNSNRVVSIKPLDNGSLLLGFDLFLYKHSAAGGQFAAIAPIKSIIETGNDTILIASGKHVVHMSTSDLSILDTIWPNRATSIGYSNEKTYVGTVDGLYYFSKGQPARNLGITEPHLRYRIAAICRTADGAIWVATLGGGIIGLKNDQVFARLTIREGLVSNLCRTLFAEKNYLWVGTDKGVCKIDLLHLATPPRQYSIADGLPSNIINAIYVDSNRVYLGSPAGLTIFDERRVSDFSRCELKLLSLSISERPVAADSVGALAYYDNNMAVAFVAISFKSGGDMLYRYRLRGLKETWDSTRQTSLSYPSLPPGQYHLEIVAINKFGVVSSPINIPFSIKAPFWQTWWFLTLVVLIAIALTALLVGARFSVLRKREREKASLEQKVSKLEQLALLSQMNPHFIFNCLNSIQAFIIQNDLESTNQYLTEFARLIRQTMDSAEKGTITVAQEAIYLSRFIELEQMRFGHSFDFAISIDDHLDANDLSIPSMILQPYVENSIRHGIRYKKGQRGMVEVKFRQYGSQLTCMVEDNGIGREEARRVRSKVHVEYQSKGMSLAAERIQALNRQYGAAVTIKIVDKVDGTGAAAGTRIEIGFPLSLLSKLN